MSSSNEHQPNDSQPIQVQACKYPLFEGFIRVTPEVQELCSALEIQPGERSELR